MFTSFRKILLLEKGERCLDMRWTSGRWSLVLIWPVGRATIIFKLIALKVVLFDFVLIKCFQMASEVMNLAMCEHHLRMCWTRDATSATWRRMHDLADAGESYHEGQIRFFFVY